MSKESTSEDWEYFITRWDAYKTATRIADHDATLQLLECCEDSLRKDLHRSHSNIAMATEIDALTAIKTLAVKAENAMLSRMTLLTMTQDREEGVRSFAARLRGRAKICKFSKNCSHNPFEAVNYTDDISHKTGQQAVVLDHHIFDDRNGWITRRSPPQPTVSLTARAHTKDYEELGYRLHTRTRQITTAMTADTGCQSVLVGIKIIHKLGFKKSDLTPVKTKMSAVNRDVIPILVAVFLRQFTTKSRTGILLVPNTKRPRRSLNIYSNPTTDLQRFPRSTRTRRTQPTRQRSIMEIIPLKTRLVPYNTQHSRTETNERISYRNSQHFCQTTV